MSTGLERQIGYEKALRAHGLATKSEYMKYVSPKAEAGYTATLKMLDLAEPPDALFTVNGLIAEGALQAIRESNLTIPADIALVTFDETAWSSLVQPPITLIAQPTYEIGKTAAELLMQRIADPDRPSCWYVDRVLLNWEERDASSHQEIGLTTAEEVAS